MQMYSVRTDVRAFYCPTTSNEFQKMTMSDILYNHLHKAHHSDTLPSSKIKQTSSVKLQVKILSSELKVL